jgi:hypothetical protein
VCSLDAIRIDSTTNDFSADEYTVAIDARRKQIYWASYKAGVRIKGPAVDKPEEIPTYITSVYPAIEKLAELSSVQNVREPIYLRSPDAIPTAERT